MINIFWAICLFTLDELKQLHNIKQRYVLIKNELTNTHQNVRYCSASSINQNSYCHILFKINLSGAVLFGL